jgi:hypothetical protein
VTSVVVIESGLVIIEQKFCFFTHGSHPHFILCLPCVSSIPEVFFRRRERFLVPFSDMSSRAPDFVFAGFGFLHAFLRSVLLIFPRSFSRSRPWAARQGTGFCRLLIFLCSFSAQWFLLAWICTSVQNTLRSLLGFSFSTASVKVFSLTSNCFYSSVVGVRSSLLRSWSCSPSCFRFAAGIFFQD